MLSQGNLVKMSEIEVIQFLLRLKFLSGYHPVERACLLQPRSLPLPALCIQLATSVIAKNILLHLHMMVATQQLMYSLAYSRTLVLHKNFWMSCDQLFFGGVHLCL